VSTLSIDLLKREFESRIFVSLGIVAGACATSAVFSPGTPSSMVILGSLAGMEAQETRLAGFVALAIVMAIVSIVRMWAGTELTASRVMAFRVQVDEFHTSGPYRLVRNPIYLADFLAMCAFALCLPPVALLMPVLFWIHYERLILYEELSLASGFRESFTAYAATTPRLFPSWKSLGLLPVAIGEFRLSIEGIRHNALYLLFIPGFIAAAWTGEFLLAAVIGLPAVADWAIVHTKLGVRR
jgi:protein-S-isoprenylcysteine O-methyltransferase Ste14